MDLNDTARELLSSEWFKSRSDGKIGIEDVQAMQKITGSKDEVQVLINALVIYKDLLHSHHLRVPILFLSRIRDHAAAQTYFSS